MNMLRQHSTLPVFECTIAVLVTARTPQPTQTAQAPPPRFARRRPPAACGKKPKVATLIAFDSRGDRDRKGGTDDIS
jgi:hypothetical protein